MTASEMRGIDLFKVAGRSISGWIPSLKTGNPHHVRQPFCSQLEERLLMYLEYHPQVTWYARGDIDAHFATTYRLPIPKEAPFAGHIPYFCNLRLRYVASLSRESDLDMILSTSWWPKYHIISGRWRA